MREDPRVDALEAAAYTVPTDAPESDGTLEWEATTLVVVTARAGDVVGLGYSYTDASAVGLVTGVLSGAVLGCDAAEPGRAWAAMQRQVRNLGRPGLVATAISAVDIALWDLAARLLGAPLATVLGALHEGTPVYGSGGFTSYDDRRLAEQVTAWVGAGIPQVKIKVGRDPDRDEHRVRLVRRSIGPRAGLLVDANGAWTRKQALWWADCLAGYDVCWLEEPVSSDDLPGLRLLRDRGPAGMDVAAGEYGYDLPYFERMLSAGAVDCLQADVTRCLGISGVRRVAALCDARGLDLSLHCAPQVSAHVGTAIWHLRHLEYFHDHVRIEQMAFDGVLPPESGELRPDRSRPGLGLVLREADLAEFRVA